MSTDHNLKHHFSVLFYGAFSREAKDWVQGLGTGEGIQLSSRMVLGLHSRMYCQVSLSSSVCHHLIMGLTPPVPQFPPRVGSKHALYILLEKLHLSPDCQVSLFKKFVLLVSLFLLSFCTLNHTNFLLFPVVSPLIFCYSVLC